MKKILLTGGTGEIGAAIAEQFLKKNYHIISPSRKELNLAESNSIKEFFKHFNDNLFGFIHCAGINFPKTIPDLAVDDIDTTFKVNTLSFYHICQHLKSKNLFESNGAILAISSIYGHFSRKGRLAYSASKHALNGMVKTLAIELGENNLRINALSPGFVDTKLTRQNNSDVLIEGFKQKIPLKRLASPKDIAQVAYFLCSPDNQYIHGQCIIADGGYSIGGFQTE